MKSIKFIDDNPRFATMMKNMFILSSACLLACASSPSFCDEKKVNNQQPVTTAKQVDKVSDRQPTAAAKQADKANDQQPATTAKQVDKVGDQQLAASDKPVDIAKVSEAFGHMIGKNIATTGVDFDIAHVIKGLQDAASGKPSPMAEVECIQAISTVQENRFKEKSEINLKKAEEFLSSNSKEKNVISLESGKVQYKIEQEGTGATVESHFSPLIHYTGKFIDGTVFGSSKEDEMLSLDEIIPGLKAGLIGMKEGEKRTIYVHPEMGYGTNGYLPPNSLLTFEIEIVKANSPKPEKNESTALEVQTTPPEIVEPKTSIR